MIVYYICRNIVRCLEDCVQQLTQLTGLMDAILTKCCNLVVPDGKPYYWNRIFHWLYSSVGCLGLRCCRSH